MQHTRNKLAAFALAAASIAGLTACNGNQVIRQVPAPAGPAATAPAPTPAPAVRPVNAQRAMEIGAAAARGRAIDVWPGTERGRAVFYVDVRTRTGMVEVYVDAATGRVLKIQRGD